MSDLQISNINIGFAIQDLSDIDVWFSDLTDWLNYWKHITYGQQATLTPTIVPPYGYYVYTDPSFTGIPVTIGGIDYVFGSFQEGLEVQAQLIQLEQSYEALRAALRDGNIIAENDIPNLRVTANTGNEVDLAWSIIASEGITYNVYRSTINGFTPNNGDLLQADLTSTIYSDTTVVAGVTYYYIVEAIWTDSTFSTSNQVSAIIAGGVPTAPTAPSGGFNLTATVIAVNEIDLSWVAAIGTGITYNLYRSTSIGVPSGSGTLIASSLTSLSYQDIGDGVYNGILYGTTYYYYVIAINTGGTLSSNEATATTENGLIPLMTSNTTPSGIASASSSYNPGEAFMAFNRAGSRWIANGTTPQWVQYKFASPVLITSYLEVNESGLGGAIISWLLQGSNDGISYTTLDNVSNFGFGIYIKNFTNLTPYSYYRLYILSTANPSNPYANVSNFQIFT